MLAIITIAIFIFLFNKEIQESFPTPTSIPATSLATLPPTQRLTQTSPNTPITSVPQTPSNTQTPTPINTQIPCIVLLQPNDGADFPDVGIINFSWDSDGNSSTYRLEIRLPIGTIETSLLSEKSVTRYLDSLPVGGQYIWQVVGLDENENEVCTSSPYSFIKANYSP